MQSFRMVNGKMLRRGYTTGSCAAAAAKAATLMLLSQKYCSSVTLITPNKTTLTLDIANAEFSTGQAACAVQKDSGDDPDITNGAFVYAHVKFAQENIEILGGDGIGLVTKPGLEQPVGAFAINSVPRQMICEECTTICAEYGYVGGLTVTISIPGGKELAARTFNPRMGIKGGLSILGTTGIVDPMSEDAIVQTIRAELSILYAAGKSDIVLTIGNYGEAFARNILKLPLDSHIKCSNFIGETLSLAAETGFTRALLIGHVGKLVKLGIGIMNTHSKHGDGRMETIIACALEAGGSLELLHKIRECVSTDAAIACLHEEALFEKTMKLLCARIDDTLKRHVATHLDIDFVCFCGIGENTMRFAQSSNAEVMVEAFGV